MPILAGALIQLSQGFYFQALEHTEAGIVAAYWNMVPTLMPIASFLLFGNVLGLWTYVGITLMVIVLFCLLEANLKKGGRSLMLMLLASILQVTALLLEKQLFEQGITFFVGFLFITIGIILSGSSPLLFPIVRKTFRKSMETLKPAIPLIIGIEIANLAALFMSQRAISLGIPSLVCAVEASIPAYTFILSFVLLFIFKRFGDEEASNRLPYKFILTGVMVLGVWLIS